mgnify:CR=1 FL=1
MRGPYHIIGGVAMLGIGRAGVIAGEHFTVPHEGEYPSWVSSALDILSDIIPSWSTWLHQMFIGDSDQWFINVAIGLLLFVIGTVLPDIDLTDSLAGRFMPWGTLWNRNRDGVSVFSPIAHRGWTHTLWALIGIGVLTAWVHPLFIWLLAGMITHDLLDAASMAGWIWYYPLFPSTWKVIERGETRIVVSTRKRGVLGNVLRYHKGVPWLEHVYVAVLIFGAGYATWYTW